jgi:hypothetical protein
MSENLTAFEYIVRPLADLGIDRAFKALGQ